MWSVVGQAKNTYLIYNTFSLSNVYHLKMMFIRKQIRSKEGNEVAGFFIFSQ